MNNHESDLELEMAFKNDFYALLYKHNAHLSDDDHPMHFFLSKSEEGRKYYTKQN